MKTKRLVPFEHIVRQAIRQRKILYFNVGDRSHMVAPHLLGVSPTGATLMQGYDLGGEESWGKAGWRIFPLAVMASVAVVDCHFDGDVHLACPRPSLIGRGLARVSVQPNLSLSTKSVFRPPSIRRRALLGANRRRASRKNEP